MHYYEKMFKKNVFLTTVDVWDHRHSSGLGIDNIFTSMPNE